MRPIIVPSLLALGLAAVTGCVASPTANFWLEARNDCVANARSLQLKVRYSPPRAALASSASAVQAPAALPAMTFRVNGASQRAAIDPASSRVVLSLDAANGGLGVPRGATIEVTGTAPSHLQGLTVLEATFHEASATEVARAPSCAPAPFPSALAYKDTSRGWLLRVRHESATRDPLTLRAFQWATADRALSLSNLAWGDAQLEALPWVDLLETERALDQGAEIVFDLPDEALEDHPVFLVRASSSGTTAAARGVVQVVPTAGTTPARAITWGEIKARYR